MKKSEADAAPILSVDSSRNVDIPWMRLLEKVVQIHVGAVSVELQQG